MPPPTPRSVAQVCKWRGPPRWFPIAC
jgi:hypothetical protein